MFSIVVVARYHHQAYYPSQEEQEAAAAGFDFSKPEEWIEKHAKGEVRLPKRTILVFVCVWCCRLVFVG